MNVVVSDRNPGNRRRPRWIWAGVIAWCVFIGVPDARADVAPELQTQWHQSQKIFAIAQTPDGFLWAGTDSGLLRYDGRNFRPYTTSNTPGLRGNLVRTLVVDGGGDLWIGTSEGPAISRMRDGAIDFVPTGDALAGTDLVTMGIDPQGMLLIGTDAGLFALDPARPDGCAQIAALGNAPVYDITTSADGTVWVGNDRGLWRRKDAQWNTIGEHGAVFALAAHADGRLWFSDATAGIYERSKSGEARLIASMDIATRPYGTAAFAGKGQIGDGFTALAIDGDGALWAGWRWGFGRVVDGSFQPLLGQALHTVDLLADSEGGVWAATYWGVAMRAARPRVRKQAYGPNDNEIVFAVARGADDALWVTRASALSRVRDGQVTDFRPGGDRFKAWHMRSVAPAAAGGIWLGTLDGGVVRIDADDHIDHIGAEFPPAAKALVTLLEDSGGTLWMGSDLGELYRLDGRTAVKVPFSNGICSLEQRESVPVRLRDECEYSITALHGARRGGIWLATRRNGLRRIWDGGEDAYTEVNGLPANDLLALHEDADSTLWIGTQGHGLVRWKDGVFKSFERGHGLPSQSVHGITEDHRGQMWMSTESGIVRIEKKHLQDLMDGRIKHADGYFYGSEDGLPEGVITMQSVSSPIAFMPDHRIVVPLNTGLGDVDIDRLDDTSGFADAVIEDMRINGEKTNSTRPGLVDLRFGADRLGSLEFGFNVPNFEVPHRIEVAYRLLGLQEEWQSSGKERVVRYFNLPAGRYTFEMQPRLDGRTWGKSTRMSTLRVRSFKERPAFFVLLALMSLPVLGLAYIVRLRLQRARYNTVFTERNRIARDLHDSLAQYFTGMAYQLERLGMILSGNKPSDKANDINEETKLMLAQCRLEARQAIHNLRSERLEPRSFFESLRDLAAQSRISGTAEIEFHGDGQEKPLPLPLAQQLLRIAQEATVNALTHANAHRIVIEASFNADSVTLRVVDDGEGFNTEDDAQANKPLHFGLQGMRERALAIGSNLELKSSRGGGTTIEVQVATPVT